MTRRLSEATARDIAALIDIYEGYELDDNHAALVDLARDRLGLSMRILPPGELPTPQPKPFFAILDRTLSREIAKQINRPFWIDTVGQSRPRRDPRQAREGRCSASWRRRSQTYASNSHIFLMWMVGTSVVLLTVADLVPAQPDQARSCGSPRPPTPSARAGRCPRTSSTRGAREVRQASQAFVEMRERITQHVEQRTTMLAGVSHDLRTVLTRLQPAAGLPRRRPRGAGHEGRPARDAAHARGLSGLRQRRRRRGGSATPMSAA